MNENFFHEWIEGRIAEEGGNESAVARRIGTRPNQVHRWRQGSSPSTALLVRALNAYGWTVNGPELKGSLEDLRSSMQRFVSSMERNPASWPVAMPVVGTLDGHWVKRSSLKTESKPVVLTEQLLLSCPFWDLTLQEPFILRVGEDLLGDQVLKGSMLICARLKGEVPPPSGGLVILRYAERKETFFTIARLISSDPNDVNEPVLAMTLAKEYPAVIALRYKKSRMKERIHALVLGTIKIEGTESPQVVTKEGSPLQLGERTALVASRALEIPPREPKVDA